MSLLITTPAFRILLDTVQHVQRAAHLLGLGADAEHVAVLHNLHRVLRHARDISLELELTLGLRARNDQSLRKPLELMLSGLVLHVLTYNSNILADLTAATHSQNKAHYLGVPH